MSSAQDRHREVQPPRVARWILHVFLARQNREYILGDLDEEFQVQVRSPFGLAGAQRWYWQQTRRCIVAPEPPRIIRVRKEKRRVGTREMFWQDTRLAVRMLRKAPGFTAVAVLTLALGIGANTAIFSVVNGVLLKPLPFHDPDRLVTLWQNDTRNNVEKDDLSPPNFLDWQEQSKSFEAMAAVNPWSHDYTSGDEPQTFRSALVTKGLFEMLGAKPLLGRTFLPEEFQAGRDRVAVLSYGTWKSHFGGDPEIVGRAILLDKEPHAVVGVMPENFRLRLFGPRERDLYAPQVIDESMRLQQRTATYLRVVARLKRGVTVDEARAEMKAIAGRLEQQYPRENNGVSMTVMSYQEHLVGTARLGLLVLLGTVVSVLLIACANVANLQLARGNQRQREMAIRTALGAGRRRLVRQLLTESLALALLGGTLGILLARWGVDLIVRLGPATLPRAEEVGLDGVVLAFAAGIAALTALVFGLGPALHLAGGDLQLALKEGSRGATTGLGQQRFRSALTVAQVALALVLLVGAGLLARSFAGLIRVNPGFDVDRILSLQVFIWGNHTKPEQRVAFARETIERFEALPGVESAGATTTLPFFFSSQTSMVGVTVDGQPAPPAGQEPTALNSMATPGYFRTLGMRLLRGRTFTGADGADAPRVAIINETMARMLFRNEDPVGRTITLQAPQPVPCEIVGVVSDLRHSRLDEQPKPELFRPHGQNPTGSIIFAIRTSNPAALAQSAKAAIWAGDKTLPIYYLSTMEGLLDRTLAERRFNLLMIGSFSGLALLVAAVGIYGVISFWAAQRTHEIGVRIALGAQRGDILRLVVRQGMQMTVWGVSLGLFAAFALTRFMAKLLYGVQPSDPVTFAGMALFLAGAALAACFLPAWRATRVDPIVALRYE